MSSFMFTYLAVCFLLSEYGENISAYRFLNYKLPKKILCSWAPTGTEFYALYLG